MLKTLDTEIHIVGAGVMGLTTALTLAEKLQSIGLGKAIDIKVYDRYESLGSHACSWWAGGMLAPYCEAVSTELAVLTLGKLALPWWQSHVSNVAQNGTLVVSLQRDKSTLVQFERRLNERCKLQAKWLDKSAIEAIEYDASESFQQAIFVEQEAHLDSRLALKELKDNAIKLGVQFHKNSIDNDFYNHHQDHHIIDCRGLSAQDALKDLRGVKGEMVLMHSTEISLSRPVRLLHPRYSIYIVPRENNLFYLGATSIENQQDKAIRVRSVLELLSTAFAFHPAFGEADIIEIGADARPAFNNNLPEVRKKAKHLYINGLYRHGFLLAPAMAQMAVSRLLDNEYEGI